MQMRSVTVDCDVLEIVYSSMTTSKHSLRNVNGYKRKGNSQRGSQPVIISIIITSQSLFKSEWQEELN